MIVIRVSREFLFGYAGSCWFFVIFIARDADESTFRHEKIHFWQQLETMIVPFFVLYLWYYLKARIRGNSHHVSYRLIPFEREAHENEDVNYKRKPYAWLRYC